MMQAPQMTYSTKLLLLLPLVDQECVQVLEDLTK